MTRDALDKLFVNCNKLEEGKARRLITKNGKPDVSMRTWNCDVPFDLQQISSLDINRFHTFVCLMRWNADKKENATLFIVIAQKGELIYLEPRIVDILNGSVQEKMRERGK
jgi:hypothetical protein